MAEKEPTQHTEQGYEIPVPKRDDVLAVFAKSAQPIDKPKKKRSLRRKRGAGK
jgi:hypothetical protein